MNPQELSDRAELLDLVLHYCRGIDRRDDAMVRSLNWNDAVDEERLTGAGADASHGRHDRHDRADASREFPLLAGIGK